MTITIPDWIVDWVLCGPFWAGFATAILLVVCLLVKCFADFKIWR